MTARIFVVVPVRDELEHTRAFVECMRAQTHEHDLIILDNGSVEILTKRYLARLAEQREVRVVDASGMTIYETWNDGFRRASLAAGVAKHWHVLVSNNDVLLPPHALAQLSAALAADESRWVAYPDYGAVLTPTSLTTQRLVDADPAVGITHGVWGSNGMSGSCFMLAGDRIPWRPLIQDLAYQWWYGDNHLARAIEQAGGQQTRVLGLPMWHAQSATARHHPELDEVTRRDYEHWMATARLPAARGARSSRRDWRGQRAGL